MAKSASEASKFLAADKQARNRAAGDESATYNGLEVSETREWRSAEAIDELLTLVTALSAKLTAQKAAHAKMLRDEAHQYKRASRWDVESVIRRLADKIEGGE
jgi:hypothetical protein